MKVIKREAVTEKIPLAWFFSVFSFIALPGLSWKNAPHCRQDGGSSRVKELISVESDCCSMLEKDGKKSSENLPQVEPTNSVSYMQSLPKAKQPFMTMIGVLILNCSC